VPHASTILLDHLNKAACLYTYYSDGEFEKNEMGWACSTMGERRGTYRVLMRKPEGKIRRGRPRRRLDDNIKMDLQEVGCGSMYWIELGQNRERWRTLVNTVRNLQVP
jgi:hypothetical protein